MTLDRIGCYFLQSPECNPQTVWKVKLWPGACLWPQMVQPLCAIHHTLLNYECLKRRAGWHNIFAGDRKAALSKPEEVVTLLSVQEKNSHRTRCRNEPPAPQFLTSCIL